MQKNPDWYTELELIVRERKFSEIPLRPHSTQDGLYFHLGLCHLQNVVSLGWTVLPEWNILSTHNKICILVQGTRHGNGVKRAARTRAEEAWNQTYHTAHVPLHPASCPLGECGTFLLFRVCTYDVALLLLWRLRGVSHMPLLLVTGVLI